MGLWIHGRLIGGRVQGNTQGKQELKVGVVAGQGEYLIRGQHLFAIRPGNPYMARLNAFYVRFEEGANLAGLDAIFYIRAEPQYLIVEPSSASRWIMVTFAPAR